MNDLQQRQWMWDENSVLNDIGPYTETKEIFDAVCKEVSRYYTGKQQFKTYKRKIKWTGDYLNCQFCFWSAGWNTQGQSVCFNIVATMYSNDITDMDRKGIIGDLRYKYREIFNVYNIDTNMFFEIVDYIDEMVEYLKSLDSFDGFKKHMEEYSEHYKIFELESNGMILLNQMIIESTGDKKEK